MGEEMRLETRSGISFSEGAPLMEARPKSLVEAMVEETADSTVAFNLRIAGSRKEKGSSRQTAARKVWAATVGWYFGAKELAVPLVDDEGRVGVALPNTNTEMPVGLGREARSEAEVRAGRVKNTIERTLLYQAVIAAEGRGKIVNFEAFAREFGLSSVEAVRDELRRIRQEVLPKQMGELTQILWDPAGVEKNNLAKRLGGMLQRFTTRPGRFIPTEQVFEIEAQEQTVDKKKVARNLVFMGMAGLALAACSSPGFAGSEGSPIPKPSEIAGNGGENVPGTGGEKVTPTEEVPTEIPTEKPTATNEPTQTPTPEPTPTPTPTEIPTFSEDQLEKMSDDEKLTAAPESVEEYTKSNVSTVKGSLVIYRDGQGQAEMVYDLTTGESMTLKEGGIVELDLYETMMYPQAKEGEKLELLAFATPREAFEYIVLEEHPLRDGDYYPFSPEKNSHHKFTEEEHLLRNRLSSTGGKWGQVIGLPAWAYDGFYRKADEVPFAVEISDAGPNGDMTTLMYKRDEGGELAAVVIYDQNALELYELLEEEWHKVAEAKEYDPEDSLVPPQPEELKH